MVNSRYWYPYNNLNILKHKQVHLFTYRNVISTMYYWYATPWRYESYHHELWQFWLLTYTFILPTAISACQNQKCSGFYNPNVSKTALGIKLWMTEFEMLAYRAKWSINKSVDHFIWHPAPLFGALDLQEQSLKSIVQTGLNDPKTSKSARMKLFKNCGYSNNKWGPINGVAVLPTRKATRLTSYASLGRHDTTNKKRVCVCCHDYHTWHKFASTGCGSLSPLTAGPFQTAVDSL